MLHQVKTMPNGKCVMLTLKVRMTHRHSECSWHSFGRVWFSTMAKTSKESDVGRLQSTEPRCACIHTSHWCTKRRNKVHVHVGMLTWKWVQHQEPHHSVFKTLALVSVLFYSTVYYQLVWRIAKNKLISGKWFYFSSSYVTGPHTCLWDMLDHVLYEVDKPEGCNFVLILHDTVRQAFLSKVILGTRLSGNIFWRCL